MDGKQAARRVGNIPGSRDGSARPRGRGGAPNERAFPPAGPGPVKAGANAAGMEASLNGAVADARLMVVGHAAWLMMNSPAHRHLFVTELEWLILPPIMLRQMRVWRRDGKPVIYASWAEASEEVETRLLAGHGRLAPPDWNSGDRPWLIDMVAPWGGAREVVKELREQVFKGRELKMLRGLPARAGAQSGATASPAKAPA